MKEDRNIHELISERKSIRAFEDKSIDENSLLTLVEAARWAPSSRNEQPWRFIIARRAADESFDEMLSCLNENNRIWARHCSALILVLSKVRFSDPDILNTHALFDTGLAVANLSLQATSMNIFMHQLGGFNATLASQVFHVPDGFEPVIIIALGYKGNAETLPEHLRAREVMHRQRKPLEELVFSNKFGEPSNLLNESETERKEK